MKQKTKKVWGRILIALVIAAVLGAAALFGMDAAVKENSYWRMMPAEQAAELKNADCILVLGCAVYEDGTPCPMLRDRLDRGIELYKAGVAPKLLLSGDHGQIEYDEVTAMLNYCIKWGVPAEDIFLDHAGFSTYESMYRAKEIFGVKTMVIVTQEYHLYRALYDAERLGIESYGVESEGNHYGGQFYRDVREILARAKDFVWCIVKPQPTYLGDPISLNGDGTVTHK